MKKITILFSLLIILQLFVQAQGSRSCSTMENLDRLKAGDPALVANMDAIEAFTNDFVSHNPLGSRVVVTIPVVVHVVYNTSTQNISDAQINSQITILNNDFRKLNADRTSVPSAFSGVSADCEINFCLAQRTPSGTFSTGIVRVSTSTTSFIDNDMVKSSATGGDDPWDATRYLNIWVCNLGGGLLGYAQFPGGSAATDGVVINYTAFGNTGTAASPYNLGRTATHEIGHWLNLRHIWGDASCGSDLISDTPTQSTYNYGCPSFPHITCGNAPNGDMWMNYMDYTDDRCMYMFTTGQKARMQALFASGGARVGLVTSTGCTPGSCTTPSGLSASGITSSGATLTWTAVAGASSYNIQYKTSSASSWITTTASTNSKVLSGLTASTVYNYKIQTVCSASSSSAYSSTASFTTASSCAVPTGLSAGSITSTGATLSWTAVSGATSYNIQYKVSSASSWTTTTSSTNSKVLSGLTASTIYSYQIQTVCSSSSTSAYSTASTFTTAAPACAVPSGLSAGSITSTGATLSWTAVSGATSYNIQYKVSSASSWTTTTSSTNSKALSGLTASTVYSYQIQTVCSSSSTSAYSTAASFSTIAVACSADAYEANNSLAAARAISNNTDYLAYICPTGDEDWYRFTTTSSARNIRVTLTTLPMDYDLYVYNSAGTLLGSSTNSGTTNETYTLNGGAVGNYYFRVVGYSGATSPSLRYTARATTSSSSLRTAGTEEDVQIADIVDESTGFIVYPNPANDHVTVSYTSKIEGTAVVAIYDAIGQLISHTAFSVSGGLNQTEINTNALNNGYYFIVLQDGNAKFSTKVLIEK